MTFHAGGPVVFLDTETTGLDLGRDSIWELAWCRRSASGLETWGHRFVKHSPVRMLKQPAPFVVDYRARYKDDEAITSRELESLLNDVFVTEEGVPATLVGSNPGFDAGMLRATVGRGPGALPGPIEDWQPRWHYHLADLHQQVVGYLLSRVQYDTNLRASLRASWRQLATTVPQSSYALFRAIGVEPDEFETHTAMGDVKMDRAVWDAMRQTLPEIEVVCPYCGEKNEEHRSDCTMGK